MSDAFITRRAGGTKLNFSVVGGIAPPSAPKENTIWVETSVGFPGWTFSSCEPELPQDGMLWFKTYESSHAPFNALKKNALWIRPTNCVQYTGGSWVNRTAKIWQNGAWKEFRRYLFQSGKGEIVPWKTLGGTIAITDTSISHTGYSLCTVSPVDFSGYSKICFDILPQMDRNSAGHKFGVTIAPKNTARTCFYASGAGTVPDNAIQNEQYTVDADPITKGFRNIVSLPIASAAKAQPYYLGFGVYSGTFILYNVWLE